MCPLQKPRLLSREPPRRALLQATYTYQVQNVKLLPPSYALNSAPIFSC